MTKLQEDFLDHTQKQIAFCDEEMDRIGRRMRDGDSCQDFSDYLLENEGNGAASEIKDELLYQIDIRDQMIEQLRYKLHVTSEIAEMYRIAK